jgi:hypothetical protein
VDTENDGFFLRISNAGDWSYEGADLGILITRGRLMTDEFALNERARAWLAGLRAHYRTESEVAAAAWQAAQGWASAEAAQGWAPVEAAQSLAPAPETAGWASVADAVSQGWALAEAATPWTSAVPADAATPWPPTQAAAPLAEVTPARYDSTGEVPMAASSEELMEGWQPKPPSPGAFKTL